MSENLHLPFIRLVNQLAWESAEEGMDPFAAILVKDGEVVASSKDKCIIYSDPTAHAELVVISEYCRSSKLISLEGVSLYCNTEPCVMCSGAIHWARLSTVVFSVSQIGLQRFSGGKPKPSCEPMINIGGKKTEVIGPLLEEDGLKVFKSFPFLSKKERHAKRHKK